MFIQRIFALPYPELLPVLAAFIPEGNCSDPHDPDDKQSIEESAVDVHVGQALYCLHCLTHRPTIEKLRSALGKLHVLQATELGSYHKSFLKLTSSTQFKSLLKDCHEEVSTSDLDQAAQCKADDLKSRLDSVRELAKALGQNKQPEMSSIMELAQAWLLCFLPFNLCDCLTD